MINWTAPANVILQSLALVKSIHFLDGFFVWQFFTTLPFEIDFYRGMRKLEWTLAFYTSCRLVTVINIVAQLVGINITYAIKCSAWNRVVLTFSYLGVALASALFITQVYVVWQRQLAIIAVPCLLTLATFGMMLYEIHRAQSIWSPLAFSCANVHTDTTRNVAIMSLVVYFTIFISYTVGVYKNWEKLSKAAQPTYKRCILFVSLPLAMQTLPVIFISMDLNDPMNLMFQVPALITGVSCATEMYREIYNAVAPRKGASSLAIGASYFSTQNSARTVRLPNDGSIPLSDLRRSAEANATNSGISKPQKAAILT